MEKQSLTKKVSSLVVAKQSKKESNNQKEIDFVEKSQDSPYVLSDEQNQNDFQKQHQQYLQTKQQRKKEFFKKKIEEFGTSSSEEDDIGISESDSGSEKRVSNIQEQKKFRESQSKKMQYKKEQKMQIHFSTSKSKQASFQTLTIQQHSLKISEKYYYLKEYHKIKLIYGGGAHPHKIKLSNINGDEIFISASPKNFKNFPLSFYIFAKVLEQKLLNMDKKLQKNKEPSLPGIPESLKKNSFIYGKISKKSQVLKMWEERLMVIGKEGIYIYKKFNQKYNMFISAESIKELWTRFEIENNTLVLKILHNSTKTQIGIPLNQILDKKSWIYYIYHVGFYNKEKLC